MSLARQYAAIGQAATASTEEEEVVNLANGKTFQAKVYPYSEIGITDAFGPDMRGALTVECRDFSALSGIKPAVKLSIYGQKWEIIQSGDPITGAIHWKIHVKRLAQQDT